MQNPVQKVISADLTRDGDQVDGCLVTMETSDGGRNWTMTDITNKNYAADNSGKREFMEDFMQSDALAVFPAPNE